MAFTIKPLDIGLDQVTRLRVGENAPLPEREQAPKVFLPDLRGALETLLHPHAINEQVLELLKLETIDPALLDPGEFSREIENLEEIFSAQAADPNSISNTLFNEAAHVMETIKEMRFAYEIARAALLIG